MTENTRQHRAAVVTAIVVTILWASSWVIIRIGLDDAGLKPVTFAGLRYGLAALLLMAVVMVQPVRRAELRSMPSSHLARLALLGVVFVAITQGALFVAIAHQPAATSSLVLSMTPLLVAALSRRTLAEAAAPTQVVGALLVAAGAGLYFSGSLGATKVGMVAALIGLSANVASALLGRWVNRSRTSTPLMTTAVSIAVGASLLIGIGLLVEGTPDLSARALMAVAWLAVVNTALAFTMWNYSLRHLGATESAVINNTMLVQIALLAWLFLDEVPSPLQFVGIAAITAGVIWSQRRSPAAATADIPPAPPR